MTNAVSPRLHVSVDKGTYPLLCVQARWSKMPQELFIVAYICNPAYRFEGLNESQEMLLPFALCAAVGQMYRVMFGAVLSADELQVSVNRIYQQVICVSGSRLLCLGSRV